MPLTARNSAGRRRKKTPDEKRPGESTSSQVMAPTRMKLRARRRDGAAGGSQPAEEEERSRESRSSRRKTANNAASTSAAAATAADTTSPPSTSTTTASTSTRAMVAAEDASPDSKCPICLDRFNNLAYLDRCLHRFCFPCIQEWSHNKAECPLCKQPFTSILHSVRAEDDFKEYTLRPPPASSSVAATVAMVAAMVSAARNDPRMLRLMLRRNRTADGGESLIRRTRRERGGRGGRGAGVWEMYFDSPTLPLTSLSPNLAAAEDGGEGEELGRQTNRRRPDPGRGVIFDGLTGPRPTRTHNDRTYRRLMTRLVARRRQQQEGGAVRRLRERETVAFRRGLYRCGIRVHGVAGFNDNQAQQCDISAESFRHNPAHLNKLRPWLRRELTVLYGAHNSLVDIVQRIIMAQLSRHGLEDTPTIEDELRPFLLARTDHFLHELVSFARSPLTLENYDLQAVYEPPAAAMELEGMSSPSDSSSVIAISEGEEEEGPVGGRSAEGRVASAHDVDDDVIQAGSCLSLSAWDDETPGPSYSTAEPSCSLTPLTPNSAHHDAANEEGEKAEEECLIVGYKKPIAERTPELVQLSSDTEEDDVKAKKEESADKAPPLPSTTSPPLSIPPSTSSAFREEQDESLKEKADGAAACRSRARSWSASSGRSHESVSSLSPSERPHDWKQQGGDNRRRRKKRRRTQEKSGTLYNPNRSIYPAMLCRRPHTPSPFHSSVESGSPLPPSPLDSSWDFNCSSLSSSPSHTSSPLCLSPQRSSPQTPPTPSLSPSDAHNREKPGGKRKYKSRHLDSNDKDPTWRPSGGRQQERRRDSESRKRKARARDGRRRRWRKESGGYHGDSSRKCRDDRSPSVEIVYERSCAAAPPPSRKRRRKGHRNPQHSSSPVIITLDSDSSRDAVNSSSSPLSSQQTVDFSDLPPLPLVHSDGMGGALDEEIGELPINILDRGSDGSEAEPPGRREAVSPIDVGSNSNSDRDIDVENDDGDKPSSSVHEPIRAAEQRAPAARNKCNRRKSTGKKGGDDCPATNLHKSASPSDSRLLAAILEDLKGIVAPKRDLSLTFDSSRSPDSRRRRSRNPCKANRTHSKPDTARDPELKHQSQDSELPTCSSSAPSLSPPQQTRRMDVPPLLKRASPVRSHNRNTPPPLKHKDAGSPQLSPVTSLFSEADSRDSNLTLPLIESRLPPGDDVIPPISTLKKHFAGSLALRGVSGSTGGPATPADISNHNPPVDYRSSFGSDDSSASIGSLLLPISFYSPSLHSSCDGWPPQSLRFPPVNFLPANSVSPVNFHSMEPGWSKPPHANYTSVGHREKTAGLSSSRVPPDDFHGAGDAAAGSGVSSDVSSTLLASTVEARTHNSSSPVEDLSPRSRSPGDFHLMEPGWSRPAHTDSPSVSHGKKTVGLSSSRVPPDDFHVGAGDAATGSVVSNSVSSTLLALTVEARTHNSSSPVDSHSSCKGDNLSQRSRSPERTVHSSSAASEGLTGGRSSSTANHEGHLPPNASLNSHITPSQREGRLNHAALPSSVFDVVTAEDNSQSERVADSQPKLHNPFDEKSVSQVPVDALSEQNLAMDSKSSHRDGRVTNSDASGGARSDSVAR
uniref:E3 ubiquitin-protein ligase Topors-like n=1 Tax=Solea senegalensis TaxID=28829 RepID=UPI001CD8B1B6|nr:E3 ubiquitin-protein ligase Topors-like [Solea senegalensis]